MTINTHVPDVFVVNTDGQYVGLVFRYVGGYSHSLLIYGSALLPTQEAATADLLATKARLPASVHTVIYGRAA